MNYRDLVFRLLAGAIVAAAMIATVHGASLETLVMPGPVIEAHQELESECKKCHSPFEQQLQRPLCLSCHDRIEADITTHTGFHGLDQQAGTAECRQCHTEHKGRDADVLSLVPELFDHHKTRFPLDGRHERLNCESCHKNDAPFRNTPVECSGCHEADDVHQNALGAECDTCHQTDGWKKTTFNHDLATDFALKGAHQTASCTACHDGSRYEGTPRECIGCHKGDDVHQGSRGDRCSTCHNVTDWKESVFDHRIETGFALLGAHKLLQCSNCHLKDMALTQPPTTCAGCHASHDPHQGRNGSECSECHTQASWKTRFDHHAKTGFALLGAHAELACTGCHTGQVTEALPTECSSCHEKDDPHQDANGQGLGSCETCHSTTDWAIDISFSHELTDFPLLGGHRLATCEQCHDGLKFSFPRNPADVATTKGSGQSGGIGCRDCHADDDPHEGALGSRCSRCHNPVAWSLWEFEHDKKTDFPLTGAHTDLVCAACHPPGTWKSPSQSCNACHRSDDIHAGGFGRDCAACHVTSSFSTIEIRRAQ